MLRVVGPFILFLGLLSGSDFAANTPACSLTVAPVSGVAPLTVTATGNCSEVDLNDNPIPLAVTLNWGDNTIVSGSSGTHRYASAGSYTVVVMAIDPQEQTASASQVVTVNNNSPPNCTLTVTPTTGTAPLNVTATGNCTDPDQNIVSTSLDWGDGTLTQGTTSGTHTYSATGTFTVRVSATDSFQSTGTASKVVTVSAINQPPTCTLSVIPNSGAVPLTVTATGSCTDPEGRLVSTSLDWGDGITQSSPSGTHTFSAAGIYAVVLTGTDDQQQTGKAQATVTVSTSQSVTCTLSVTPNTGVAPLMVTATGNCTEPQSDITTTSLNWGDGSTQNGSNGTHTYSTPGTYTVVLSATDAAEHTGTASQVVHVTQANGPPTCTLSVTPSTGVAPLTVSANGACMDPDNNLASTSLTWGDGAQQTAASGPHTYTTAGTFTVTLTGTDSQGLTGTASATVTVTLPTVYLGAAGGHVIVLNPDGSTANTLDTTLGGTVTGMAFDQQATLYVTDFTAGNVTRFSTNGTLVGNFGSGYNCQPESASFDRQGNLYVGLAGCKKNVLKFDSSGNLANSFTVKIEDQGADWIDISADGCTLFYTSEGHNIMRYNVCGNQQLGDFATGLHLGLALRILPDGGVLVADSIDIHRTDANGNLISTYDQPGEDCWVALTLDPDGKTFWAADACTSHVYQMDIASGAVVKMLSPSLPAKSVYGIAITGESGANNSGVLAASPLASTVSGGGSITFTVTLQSNGANPGPLLLTCSNLPVGMKCSFSPPSISPGGTSTLTISTNNQTTIGQRSRRTTFFAVWTITPMVMLAVMLSPVRRRWKLLLTSFLVIGLMACGSSSTSTSLNPTPPGVPQPGITPAGTYTIGVNAGNGPAFSTTSITLTVKP